MIDNLNNILMGFVYFYIASFCFGIACWGYLLCVYNQKRAWSFFIKFEFHILILCILCCSLFVILKVYSIM